MSLGSKTGLGVNFTGGGQTPGFSRLFLSSSRFFISSEVTSSPLGSTKLMGLFRLCRYAQVLDRPKVNGGPCASVGDSERCNNGLW